MEEPHVYEMVGNPSYANKESLEIKAPPKSRSVKSPKSGRLAVFCGVFCAALAASSIAVSVWTHFNMKTQNTRIHQMIMELRNDTQQLSEIMSVSSDELIAGKIEEGQFSMQHT
jgi:hypothetical protein